ncbi:MAG TPA: hypothetical protein VFF04_00620 [Candidatus Babeliales bacterium]|nr:hypothetical protein [Candidatus Babeliales bacterium]
MSAIEKIQSFIDNLEERTFYIYLSGIIAALLILSSLIIWHYYSSIHDTQEHIANINEQRDQVRRILATYEQVKKHQKEVNTLLAADEGFKIEGYYKDVLLPELGLSDKQVTAIPSHISMEKFDEVILKATLAGLDMKELCELLQTLDANKRIYTKELEITKSKTRKAIDVTLTIASLEPHT